jgi:putative membrane protein
MKFLSVSAAALLGATLAVGAQAQQAQPRTAPSPTAGPVSTPEYVESQARGDLFEIDAGKIAQQKAQNADVKQFAQEMIADHTLSQTNMQKALKDGKVSTPVPKNLDVRHNQALNELNNTPPGQFDQQYLQSQVTAHREVLALNQTYSQSGGNAALKQYAQETIPVVQNHLSELEQMAQAGKPAGAGTVSSGSGGSLNTQSGVGVGAGAASAGSGYGSSGKMDVLDPGTGASSGAGIGQQVIQQEPIGPGGPRQFNQPSRDDGGLRDD